MIGRDPIPPADPPFRNSKVAFWQEKILQAHKEKPHAFYIKRNFNHKSISRYIVMGRNYGKSLAMAKMIAAATE